jgi:ribonuclease P protein component
MKNTIKAHKNFDFKGSGSIAMPSFFLKYRAKKFDRGQYGLVASKKMFPLAVHRNRAKRLLREWTRMCGLPEHLDILIIARAEILETRLASGHGQMKKALKRAVDGNSRAEKPAAGRR